MSQLTLNDLREIMRRCAGVDDEVDLDGAIEDTNFTDLGYDSLAVMEIHARIQQDYGVSIPEDLQADLATPAATVEFVNEQLGQPAPVSGRPA
jgi:act minimal PKS acyl carrier protein